MTDAGSARHDELLVALYLGEFPSWVSPADRERLRLASDRHRLGITQHLATAFPRASLYASAVLGMAFFDGVVRCLVSSAPVEVAFSMKVSRAAMAWSVAAPAVLAAVFEYDHLVGAPLSPYDGPDRDELARALSLTKPFALRSFEYDVVGFGELLNRFRQRAAPPDLIRRYAPAKRRQVVACYDEDDAVRVREVALA